MADWWINNRKRLPQSISAFANWLAHTQIDQTIRSERLRLLAKEEEAKKQEEYKNIKPVSQETLDNIRRQIGKRI